MTALSSSPSPQLRPSLWEGIANPFTLTPMHSDETVRQIHYTRTLPMDPGPSNSNTTRRGSPSDEFGLRPRPTLRTMKSKDSVMSLSKSSKRTSFIDLGDVQPPSSGGGFIGSLKGRLSKKRSAPLLSGSVSAPSFYSTTDYYSSTPTGDSSQDSSPSSSVPRDSYFSLKPKPSKSFRDERKRTAIPEEIVDGIGKGVRFSPSILDEAADDDTDVADEEVDISKGKYRSVPLRRRHGTLVHAYTPGEAPYAQSYNKVDMQAYV